MIVRASGLKDPASAVWDVESLVPIPHIRQDQPTCAWFHFYCYCIHVSSQDGSISVEIGFDNSVRKVGKDVVRYPIYTISSLRVNYDDMVRMEDVNHATILHNLRLRFLNDQIYTNIGTILVSVNPFKWIEGLYTPDAAKEHMMVAPGDASEPHIYAIAGAAFRGMLHERHNQSIVISGESGAGKTEATKQCLKFFVEATRRQAVRAPIRACRPHSQSSYS